MKQKEAEEWISQNCTEHHREYINGISYVMATMKVGWVAVLHVGASGYTPVVKAENINHARSYCNLIEPVTVPMQEICPEVK